MKTVHTENAPAAIGPYSQAKISGSFVFTSGQIPVNPSTSAVEQTTIEDRQSKFAKMLLPFSTQREPP